jgi:hypothetical protein
MGKAPRSKSSKKGKGCKAKPGVFDECPRYHNQWEKLQKAAWEYDIGFRVLNQINGHCRVDSTIDYWLGSEKWIESHRKGKGLHSMISHILGERGE